MTTSKGMPVTSCNGLSKLTVAERIQRLANAAVSDGLVALPGFSSEVEELHALLDPVLPPQSVSFFAGDRIAQSTYALGLHAPLLLIKQLRCFAPELLSGDKPLRVLMLGAGRDEVLDGGRWYYLAWILCGLSPRRLVFTAIGPQLDDPEASQPTPASDVVDEFPDVVTRSATTLMNALPVGGGAPDWEEYFDLVVMNHPGFVAHFLDWSNDEAWNDLISFARIPVVGCSYDATDLHFDRVGMSAHGRVMDRVFWNPTAHGGPGAVDSQWGTRLLWGGVLWGTSLDPDVRENAISAGQDVALQWFSAFLQSFCQGLEQFGGCLAFYNVCPGQLDVDGGRVWISDHVAVSVPDGVVYLEGTPIGSTPSCVRLATTKTVAERINLVAGVLDEFRRSESISNALRRWSASSPTSRPAGAA